MEEVAPGLGVDTYLDFREASMCLCLPPGIIGLLDDDEVCSGVKALRPQTRECVH